MWSFLKKPENRATRTLRSILLLVVYLKKPRLKYHGNTCTSIFTDTLFTVVKIPTQTTCPLTDRRIKKKSTHIWWNFNQPKKNWNHGIRRNMDETGKYYVRLNKPDWESQVLHVSSYVFLCEHRYCMHIYSLICVCEWIMK